MSDYQPVSCDIHSQFERLAMHAKHVSIIFLQDGKERHYQGQVIDVMTREKAEYLVIETPEGRQQLRLDWIVSLKDEDGIIIV